MTGPTTARRARAASRSAPGMSGKAGRAMIEAPFPSRPFQVRTCLPGRYARPTMNALRLGGRAYDLTTRTLVMGILDDAPAQGLDALLRRAEQLVAEGA